MCAWFLQTAGRRQEDEALISDLLREYRIGLAFSPDVSELNEGLPLLILAIIGAPLAFVNPSAADIVISNDPAVVSTAANNRKPVIHYCLSDECFDRQHPLEWRETPRLAVIRHDGGANMELFYAFLFRIREELRARGNL